MEGKVVAITNKGNSFNLLEQPLIGGGGSYNHATKNRGA